MSDDPFRGPPGTNPPRHLRPDGDGNDNGIIGWTLGIAAVLVAFALAIYGISGRIHTAAVDPPSVIGIPAPAAKAPARGAETTGRSDRVPATPLPYNPNGTQPQIDPSSPIRQIR